MTLHNTPAERAETDPATREAAAIGHETRDVNIRGILWLAAGTAVGTVLVAAGLWLLLQRYALDARRADPQLSPLSAVDEPPPPPHLQDAPIRDYQKLLRQQEARLSSYGWVDRRQGIVRIPIDRAMELIEERGLASRQPPAEVKPSEEDRAP